MLQERYTQEEVKDLLNDLIEQADKEIIDAIRSQPEFRDDLLAQLDALEKVRTKLYATINE